MKDQNNNFENDYKMLTYFQDEFVHRDEHFWKMVIYSFLLVVVISILPIVNEIFGISIEHNTVQAIAFVFPFIGAIISVLSFIILSSEAKRVNAVNQAKYRINKMMDEKYQYVFYKKSKTSEKESKKPYSRKINGKNPLVCKIPYLFLLFEFLILIVIFVMLVLR